ncbi:amidohydrolase (plasmid) [Mesorhizobium sp. B2-1-8]|uniref:amidohydrolase family protein n=1 Tax=Mesorhizobium sp. B2-1-8 TaxID=2589967 RepID=UPI001AEE6F8C|nr:amidohydrolase family protein [Mesorhizobium sp. B2-1-8]UCI22801.1 amidohydrolase [Mesorhizobium sp. B2-1-8]
MSSTPAVDPKGSVVMADNGVVDCDIHPSPRDGNALKPYLPQRWRDHLDVFGDPQNGPYAAQSDAYPRYVPHTARRDAWPPVGGAPGSDVNFMREQHLDKNNITLGILEPLGLGNSARNLDLGNAVCTAVNDWQVAEFVDREPRLRASVLIVQDDADAAVAEIERRASDSAFAQVQLPSLTTEPLGHRRYRKIFGAAAHHGFPVGIHVGGPSGARTSSGWGSYYNEEHFALIFSMQTQVISMILEGVFEDFPDLRVILIEGGAAWSISLGYRLDRLWKTLRSEHPQIKHPPSSYLRKHFYFSSQPVEEPDDPNDLLGLYEQIGWDRVLYASDYPHWDFDDPKYAFKADIPDDKRAMLLRKNAKGLYRLL